MKAAAIILVIVLVLLLPIANIIYGIVRAIREKNKGTSPHKPATPTKNIFRRKIGLLVGSAYVVALIIAIVWAALLISKTFNIPSPVIIFTGILTFLLLAIQGIVMFFWVRYTNKMNPRPQTGSDVKTILTWENRYADLFVKNIWKILGIILGASLLVVAIVVITFLIFYR